MADRFKCVGGKGHEADWSLTLPKKAPGSKHSIIVVGCEDCKTAVPAPWVEVGKLTEADLTELTGYLLRMGMTLRDWREREPARIDPRAN